MYLSPKSHARITGAPVRIGKQAGARFSAFGGELSGTMLATVPDRLIVQSWRSCNFKESDPDSILILSFTPVGKNSARIDLVHVNVAKQDHKGVAEGWPSYYWKPWRKFLKQRSSA